MHTQALAPEAKLTYEKGGPAAEARFEAGVAGFEARAFRGCGIMTSEPFEVSDDQDSVQMLTRNSQVGEFYVLQPPQVDPGADRSLFTCDSLIYDEESDRHVRITWGQALAACCISELDPTNTEVAIKTKRMTDKKLETWLQKARNIQAFNEGEAGTAENGMPASVDADSTWARIDKDIRIVVARPFIEHLMHSVIMAVSGRDTGATLFGPADMQLSANTQVKTIEGHYTGHFKAVVTKPQNVLVMRDVACAGYVAGCNTLFFAQDSVDQDKFSMTAAGTNMMERLSFANDVGAKYASMLAFPCTAQQMSSGHLDTVMSVTTRLLPWEVTSATGGDHHSFPGGQQVFEQYQRALGLRSVHFGEDMKAAENQDFISQGSTNNATCFIGPHRLFDPFTRSFMNLVPGQGHFGPDAIPGVIRALSNHSSHTNIHVLQAHPPTTNPIYLWQDARWRRGESVSLKTARDTMVPLELAQHAQMAYSKAS